jgi:hypothetical protein
VIPVDCIEDLIEIRALVPSSYRHPCPSDRPADRIIVAPIELLGDDFDVPVLDSGLVSVAQV